jgi:hypothetical protein
VGDPWDDCGVDDITVSLFPLPRFFRSHPGLRALCSFANVQIATNTTTSLSFASERKCSFYYFYSSNAGAGIQKS